MSTLSTPATMTATTETETRSEISAAPIGSTEQLLRRYNRCGDCGSNMHFRHTTDFSRNLTSEVAQCPECGAKPRSILHRLQ